MKIYAPLHCCLVYLIEELGPEERRLVGRGTGVHVGWRSGCEEEATVTIKMPPWGYSCIVYMGECVTVSVSECVCLGMWE